MGFSFTTKQLDLKGQKKAHMRRFTGLERAFLFVPTGAYILFSLGRTLRKVRREKARQEQLGVNRKQYKRLKNIQKIDKKFGRENYNELKPVGPTQEYALNDKDDFKRYKDEYRQEAEAEKSDFIAETSKGAFRQKRHQNRRNSRAEETRINKESKRDLKETRARKRNEDSEN